MKDPFVIFWTILFFASIGWYAFLVFYLGIRAGREIKAMTRVLEEIRKKHLSE